MKISATALAKLHGTMVSCPNGCSAFKALKQGFGKFVDNIETVFENFDRFPGSGVSRWNPVMQVPQLPRGQVHY